MFRTVKQTLIKVLELLRDSYQFRTVDDEEVVDRVDWKSKPGDCELKTRKQRGNDPVITSGFFVFFYCDSFVPLFSPNFRTRT